MLHTDGSTDRATWSESGSFCYCFLVRRVVAESVCWEVSSVESNVTDGSRRGVLVLYLIATCVCEVTEEVCEWLSD